MKEFLTDSIYFKKNNKDFLFFPNDIFKWRVENNEDYFFINRSKNNKVDKIKHISGVVSPSNYRIINDILELDKNALFYYPEKVKSSFTKNALYKINKNEIALEFEKYMKRGYISYLSYSSLKNLGLKRIEQFIVLLSSISFEKDFKYDNLKIKNESVIVNIVKNKKESSIKDKYLDLNRFIYAVHNELNYEFIDIFSHILKLYAELKCSDPFDNKGILFFEDDNPLYNIFKKISNIEVFYNKEIIEIENSLTKKRNRLQVNKIKTKSSLLKDYYLMQNEDFFQNKVLVSKEEYPTIIDITKYLKNIFPFKDILLTIQLLERMKKIRISDMKITINPSLKKRLEPKVNKDWVSLNKWREIYSNVDYIYNDIINPIYSEKIQFCCPLCENNVYSITPQQLFCSKLGCNFALFRTNLKSFGVKKISLENMIDGLKNKSILLEKDNGGQLPVFLKQNKDFFYFWIDDN